jgi:hypothetical protein
VRATHRLLLLSSEMLLANAPSFCQAWVPLKGEGEMAVSYQNLFTRDHFNGDGSRHDYGHIRLYGGIGELDYGVTNKFAVNLSVPYGVGKYNGPFPHQLPIDDGTYTGELKDLHVGFCYNVLIRDIQFTLFLSVSFLATTMNTSRTRQWAPTCGKYRWA